MPQLPIHILGIGGLGQLFAHSLRRCHPELPITLLFHRPNLKDQWNSVGRAIEVVRNGTAERQMGFDHEDLYQGRGEIRNLICATKTYGSANAIKPLKERLGPSSNILFLQNGIGSIEEITTQVFNQASARPRYFAGIVNHGVYTTAPFSCVHASVVDVAIGAVATPGSNNYEAADENPFIQEVLRCPVLSASSVTSDELLYTQLRKLTINAVINPLSTIFDCINGDVFRRPSISAIVQPLVAEISAVIQAIIVSKNEHADPAIFERFGPESLAGIVHEVGQKVVMNSSSMRQDMRAGRRTEIDYINGYIIKQGAVFGIPTPINQRLYDVIIEKRLLSESQASEIMKG